PLSPLGRGGSGRRRRGRLARAVTQMVAKRSLPELSGPFCRTCCVGHATDRGRMLSGRTNFGFSVRKRSNLAISVLLADDSEEFRPGVRRLLESQSAISLVGASSDFSDAVLFAPPRWRPENLWPSKWWWGATRQNELIHRTDPGDIRIEEMKKIQERLQSNIPQS